MADIDVVIKIDEEKYEIIKAYTAPMTWTEYLIKNGTPLNEVLDKIEAEIEQVADKQFQIAMGIADLNERYTHIRMESAYRHSLNIIDKYRGEVDCRECKAEYECYYCKKYAENEDKE